MLINIIKIIYIYIYVNFERFFEIYFGNYIHRFNYIWFSLALFSFTPVFAQITFMIDKVEITENSGPLKETNTFTERERE